MSLISLRNACLNFGNQKILDDVSLNIKKNERICLIGRNGVGKSSLFKVIQGITPLDHGEFITHNESTVSWLEQEIPLNSKCSVFDMMLSNSCKVSKLIVNYQTLLKNNSNTPEELNKLIFLQKKIDDYNAWSFHIKIEKILSTLSLDGSILFDNLSGGLKRRVLLAKALAKSPDLLLLDEPTNHLDIESIEALEKTLLQFEGSILFITHDREFMRNISTDIMELNCGKILRFSGKGSYEKFSARKEVYIHAKIKEGINLKRKLKEEEEWIRQGLKARRKRNEGRVRALEKLRENHKKISAKTEQYIKPFSVHVTKASKIVIKAKDISYKYKKKVFDKFSCEIRQNERIAILGKNGCGKTTLLRILLKNIQPDSGIVLHGNNLKIAYFDQLRNQVDMNTSLAKNVSENSDFLEINGKKIHVVKYLQKFLFNPNQIHSDALLLSGGERSRLLLAKIFSKPSNLLIFDEPTNDLDIETLEIIEKIILNYQGTILIVSHDRSFINNVATKTIVFEEHGKLQEYVGGYDDWLRQKNIDTPNEKQKTHKIIKKNKPNKKKLTYIQKKQLKELPNDIEYLEDEITNLQYEISKPELYQKHESFIKDTIQTLEEKKELLDKKYYLWEKLLKIED